MKRILLIFIILISIGCTKKEKSTNIEMQCNDIITTIEIKKGNKISCNLLDENYEFMVKKITSDNIELEVNKYGLSDDGSITKKIKTFKIEEDKELKIHTQTTDYQQYVIFKRK